jgi:hypothetical protein
MNTDTYLKKVVGNTFARIATKSVSFGTLIQKRVNTYLINMVVVIVKQIAGIT